MKGSEVKIQTTEIYIFTTILCGISFGLLFAAFGCVFSRYLGFDLPGFEEITCGISGKYYGVLGIIVGILLGSLFAKKYLKITLAIALFILLAFISTPFYILVTNKNKVVVYKNRITLPETIFDSQVAVPGTSVYISYPMNGFYGLGASVRTSTLQGVVISTQTQYNANAGAEYVVLSGRVVRAVKSGETLKKFIESSDPPETDRDYSKTGKYELVNGQEYFVYKVTEDVTAWFAYTISNGKFIVITLAYKPTEAPESRDAYKNNDLIFEEIISRISLAELNQKFVEFTDTNTDFSFLYPSSWNYNKDLETKQEYPESNQWKFTYKNKLVMQADAPPYEPAFDGCLDVVGRDLPSDFKRDVKIYGTNDKNTTVLKQTCGFVTYITWYPGFHPNSIDEILSSKVTQNVKKMHIIRIYSSESFQDYLDWGDKIAKSIKIKTNF
jgi:hypothetical protein